METRANYLLIGLFTLAAIVAAFGFVYWFSNTGTSGSRTAYRVLFEGSVSGLRPGADVLFNGLKVGDVVNLRLDRDDPRKVSVTISVDENVPVNSDTRATIEYQILSGIGAVALRAGRPDAPPIATAKGELPTLTAEPAADVAQSARELMGRADKLLQRVDGILVENQTALRDTIRNVEAFTATLAKNSERIDSILAGLDSLTNGPDTKAAIADIGAAAKSIRSLSDNLDKRTAEISAGITRFTSTGMREVEAFANDGRRTLTEIERAVRNFDRNPSRVIFGGSGSNIPEYNGRR